MIPLALACLLLAGSPDDDVRALQDLRRSLREKGVEAAGLLQESHEDLDRSLYDSAVAKHRRARLLESEREALRKTETGRIETIAAEIVRDLDSDAVETRDRGSRLLLALGPRAIPVLQRLLPGSSAEVEYRLTDGIARLRRIEMDGAGRLHQWAATARASTEYRNSEWSAMQAIGRPDTEGPGDSRTAWASLSADGQEEWLELGYEAAVLPLRVRVHETYNPGAIVKLEGRDEKGEWKVLWQGSDPVRDGAGWFEADVAAGSAIRAIRVTLDSVNVSGWNEIDAVELIGDPAP